MTGQMAQSSDKSVKIKRSRSPKTCSDVGEIYYHVETEAEVASAHGDSSPS